MAKQSLFDPQLRPSAWFDAGLSALGWFDKTLPNAAPALVLSDSANIPAGGATVTTAQLSAPASGDSFGGGVVTDDVNPGAAAALGIYQYREDEWCMEATGDAPIGTTYEFRVVLVSGLAIDAYSFTPNLTVNAVVPYIPCDVQHSPQHQSIMAM